MIPNTAKENIREKAVCPAMTVNWVAMWERRSSRPVIPDTRDRSRMPSLRSSSMAPDVRATARKKMTLQRKNHVWGFVSPEPGVGGGWFWGILKMRVGCTF